MKKTMSGREKKNLAKKETSELVQRLLEIEKRHAKQFVDDIFWLAYKVKLAEREAYLTIFSGEGILGPGKNRPSPRDEAVKAIEPLAEMMKIKAQLMFGDVLGDIFGDPELKNQFLKKMSSLLGKQGGRPQGKRMPHIIWLEDKLKGLMVVYRDADPAFTAENYFAELRTHQDIDGHDDDELRFHTSVLEEFGWREGKTEPKITLNSVREGLTLIRKGT